MTGVGNARPGWHAWGLYVAGVPAINVRW